VNKMDEFKVKDVFFLGDGKIVFAGECTTGSQVNGLYELCIDGQAVATLTIVGEMHFPSKGTTDIAIYTFDKVTKDQVDLNRNMVLRYLSG
jgi:hypothetical protein